MSPARGKPWGGRFRQATDPAVERFTAVPGVEAAGAARVLPLSGTIGDWSITIEHKPRVTGENPNGDWQVVTPGYFAALGIPVIRGRAILPRDDETAPLVAVISETMAGRYWPGEDALGKRFHLGTSDQPWVEIVGSSPEGSELSLFQSTAMPRSRSGSIAISPR